MLAVVAAVPLIVGCATPWRFRETMDAMVGVSMSELVSRMGPPQREYPLPDGTRVLQYSESRAMEIPDFQTTRTVTSTTQGRVSPYGTFDAETVSHVPVAQPPTTVHLSCTINITIDPQGVVRRWSSQGNHCVRR